MLTISRDELKTLIHYDPETGVVRWRVSRGTKKQGSIAGCTQKHRMVIRISNKNYALHNVIWLYMTGRWPTKGMEIDHINGNVCDNRWCNIRLVTHADNCRNRSRRVDNKTGTTGVSWDQDRQTWNAYICRDGHQYSLGQHDSKEAAIAARKAAEKEYNFHPNHGRPAA